MYTLQVVMHLQKEEHLDHLQEEEKGEDIIGDVHSLWQLQLILIIPYGTTSSQVFKASRSSG